MTRGHDLVMTNWSKSCVSRHDLVRFPRILPSCSSIEYGIVIWFRIQWNALEMQSELVGALLYTTDQRPSVGYMPYVMGYSSVEPTADERHAQAGISRADP